MDNIIKFGDKDNWNSWGNSLFSCLFGYRQQRIVV